MQAHFNGHQVQCLWSLSTAASATSWTSFARRQRHLWTLSWIFPTSWKILPTTRTSAIRSSSFEGTSANTLNERGHVKCIQALISLFTFNSDSGISSETSSTYLEMRPSRLAELPTVESSEGKLVISLRFKLLKMIRSVCWSQDFIPIWFFSRPCLWGEWWLAAGYWWPAQIFLPSSSGPRLFGQEKCEFNTPLTN